MLSLFSKTATKTGISPHKHRCVHTISHTHTTHLSSHTDALCTLNTTSRVLTSAQRPLSLFKEGCLLTNRGHTHTLSFKHTHTLTEIGFQGPKYREPLLCCHSNATQTKGSEETHCLQRGQTHTQPTCCWPQNDGMGECVCLCVFGRGDVGCDDLCGRDESHSW